MVLLVGGAGYIGSHMAQRLRDAGEPHVVFDNLSKGHRQAVAGSDLVVGDIQNPEDLRRVFADRPFDVAMHFAASIEVGESVRDPAAYYRNNVVGVLNLLDAMRDSGMDCLVFSSTAAIFGEPDAVPIAENHPTCPTNPYGDTKLAVERILRAYGVAYGLRSVCLRYFNAAGADPEGRIGEDHDPETHLIPLAIQAALGFRPELTIFGTDYPTPDGTCVRDYVHICDLAEAHLHAVRHLRAGGESRRFNLGNGQGFSVRQVIGAVEKVGGRPVPHREAARRAGDPARLVASSDAIRKEWGWRPRWPDLEDIVRHAWRWQEAHPNGFE